MSACWFICTDATGQALSRQDSIIEKYLAQGAYKHHYLSQHWDDWINKALKEDTTIALLWQRKALPYWKTGKYDQAVAYYDWAVQYDRRSYLARRGYLKCIFQKNYAGAIKDLEAATQEFGSGGENDHSYEFYIAVSYLQLNQFEKAEQILKKDIGSKEKRTGPDGIHYLDLFYLGIANYELRKYEEAILYFDRSLKQYANFSDAKYYKGLCQLQLGKKEAAGQLMRAAKADSAYTIAEDDAPYERYPYQVNWYMAKWTIPDYKE